jgi:hypothetical protein
MNPHPPTHPAHPTRLPEALRASLASLLLIAEPEANENSSVGIPPVQMWRARVSQGLIELDRSGISERITLARIQHDRDTVAG